MTLANLEKILLFLTILFLPTQLGRHFWPEFSFIYSLPIDYLSPVIYFWDLLALGLIVIKIITSIKIINRLALNLFLFFILTQVLSLLGSTNLGAGLIRLEQYILAGLFGLYIASTRWEVLRRQLFWPLSLSILFESFLAIMQFIKGGTLGFWILGERTFSLSSPAIAKFDFYGREFLRPYATFPHPNVLAGFLIILLVILSKAKDITKLYSSADRLRMTLVRVTVILAGITTLLTVSRTAIVAGLISALILLRGKGRILLILAVIILWPVLFTRYSSLINYDNLTFIRREELSKVALTLWSKSPIFGVGLNNFIPVASDQLLAGPSRFLQPVHNIFLLVLAETGVIGAIGLIGLIGYPIYMRRLLPIWGVIIFLGMFDHYFLTLPQGYRLLFLIWGLTFSATSLFDKQGEDKHS